MRLLRSASALFARSRIAAGIFALVVAFSVFHLLPFVTEVKFSANRTPSGPFYIATAATLPDCSFRLVEYRAATPADLLAPPLTTSGECRSTEGGDASFSVHDVAAGEREIETRIHLENCNVVSRYVQSTTGVKPLATRLQGPSHALVGLLIGLAAALVTRFIAKRMHTHQSAA